MMTLSTEPALDTGNDGSRAPRVSVIIPTYKRGDFLRLAVKSLFAQDLPPSDYEIIVVDSSPAQDGLIALRELASNAPCRLRCFIKQAEGPGASRNMGARNARGTFLAFMDDDCQATPQWLSQALPAFTEGVGIVQGQTLPDPKGKLGIFVHYIVIDKQSALFETANILYRREAFEQVGGFRDKDATPDATTPTGGEDVMLGWKVKREGWQARFVPEALVYHAVLPITKREWIWQKRQMLWPHLVRVVPELRSEVMYGGYFLNSAHAGATLLLLGIIGCALSPWSLLLAVPYFAIRASEPSKSLRGPLKLVRPLVYLGRDVAAVCGMAIASVRARSLLL